MIGEFELRPGLGISLVAAVAATAVCGFVVAWAPEAPGVVALVVVLAGFLYALGIFFGLPPAIGAGSVVVALSAVINVAAATEPVWVEAAVTGALIYLAAEVGWEAIECRSGARRSSAMWRRWAAERLRVVALSILVALVATALSSTAPVRSLLLQSIVAVVAIATVLSVVARLKDPA